MQLKDKDIDDWTALLSGLNHCAKEILELEDYIPKVDLDLYPRTDIHRPTKEESDGGGWAWKATVKSTKPKSSELKDVRIVIKDNVAVADVVCTNGTAAVPNWVPKVDATVVTRILDAGGIITGKAACENNCFGAVRYAYIELPLLRLC